MFTNNKKAEQVFAANKSKEVKVKAEQEVNKLEEPVNVTVAKIEIESQAKIEQ